MPNFQKDYQFKTAIEVIQLVWWKWSWHVGITTEL